MLFAIICIDKDPEGLAIRKETRPAHLDFLASLGTKLKFAGPFTSPDGAKPIGTLAVIEANSLQDAEEIASRDPYSQAGVFDRVEIRAWNWLIGNPENA